MLGITGSNLTELARNALVNDQQVGGEMAAVDQRAIQRQQLQAQQNQFLQELALRKQQQDQSNAYLNNALAQNGDISRMQWTTPSANMTAQNNNALTVAKLPWTMGATPAEQQQNEIIKNNFAIAMRPYDVYAAGGPPPGNGPGGQAWAQLQIDAAQRKEKDSAAVKAANAEYLGTVGLTHFWDWALPGDRNTKIANEVKTKLAGAFPEVNELIFDDKENGGKGGFITADDYKAKQAAQPAGNPLANAGILTPRTNVIPSITATGYTSPSPLLSTGGSTNQFALTVPPQTNAPVSRIAIQNGFRYQVNPDGSSQLLGPAQ